MEQEIINTQEKADEKVVVKTESKELFEDYEMGKTHLTSTFQKILGGTIVLHVVAILILGQTGIPVGKARPCQNPFMQTVCEVIDAAYVGGMLMTTDRTSVDAPYEKTELEDAEITFIDVTNQPLPFTYPEGYFANETAEALPGEFVTDGNGMPVSGDLALNNPNNPIAGIPGFPNSGTITPNPIPSPGKLDPNKPAELPKGGGNTLIGDIPGITSGTGKNSNPSKGNRPSDFSGGFPRTTTKTPKPSKTNLSNDSPSGLPDFGSEETAKKNNSKKPSGNGNVSTDTAGGVKQIIGNTAVVDTDEGRRNRLPLTDFGKVAFKKINDSKIDLSTPVSVIMSGTLTKDGKIDSKKSRWISSQGNEELVSIIKEGILAVNDSGYLKDLKDLTGKSLTVAFSQDDEKVIAEIQSEVESETRANTIVGLLKLAKDFGISNKEKSIASKENSNPQNDIDELELLKRANFIVVGKKIVIRFDIEKPMAQAMIARKLKDVAEAETKKGQSTNKLDVASENKNANIAKK